MVLGSEYFSHCHLRTVFSQIQATISSLYHKLKGLIVAIMSIGDTEDVLDVPVLIVGGGPTGLLTAYLLSAHGGMTRCGRNDYRFGTNKQPYS